MVMMVEGSCPAGQRCVRRSRCLWAPDAVTSLPPQPCDQAQSPAVCCSREHFNIDGESAAFLPITRSASLTAGGTTKCGRGDVCVSRARCGVSFPEVSAALACVAAGATDGVCCPRGSAAPSGGSANGGKPASAQCGRGDVCVSALRCGVSHVELSEFAKDPCVAEGGTRGLCCPRGSAAPAG